MHTIPRMEPALREPAAPAAPAAALAVDAANHMSSTMLGLTHALGEKAKEVEAISVKLNEKSTAVVEKVAKIKTLHEELAVDAAEVVAMHAKMKTLRDEMSQQQQRIGAFEPQWLATCARAGVSAGGTKRPREGDTP